MTQSKINFYIKIAKVRPIDICKLKRFGMKKDSSDFYRKSLSSIFRYYIHSFSISK